MAKAALRFVTSGGIRLAMREYGDPTAPTVLLVHGFPDNSALWEPVARCLAGRFHVVTFDVRGHGDSGVPANRAGYQLDLLADDIVAMAREVSPEQPVHLVGHDWGSIQCWHTVSDPDRARHFASYTSISGPCLDHTRPWVVDEIRGGRVLGVLNQLLHSGYILFFELPVLPELFWRIPTVRARFHATWQDARNGLQLYRANIVRRAVSQHARRVTLPVQQLVPRHDRYVLPVLVTGATRWCDQLWRRELDAGHWAPRSHPELVAEAVSEFADHVGGGPQSIALTKARVGGTFPPGERR
ncbi:MAG: alpha/beta fold hydrolase [Sciscionella sp.]